MHPLILRLVKQLLDPPRIVLHSPKRFEMAEHASHHSRDTCHRLQHNGAMDIAFAEERIGKEAEELDGAKGDVVGEVLWFPMVYVNVNRLKISCVQRLLSQELTPHWHTIQLHFMSLQQFFNRLFRRRVDHC